VSGIVGEGEVPHLLNAVGSLTRTLAASLRYGHLPTAEEIDAIMQVCAALLQSLMPAGPCVNHLSTLVSFTTHQELFDGKRKFVAGAASTLHLKASPPGTLLASLSAQLLNMRTLHGSSLHLVVCVLRTRGRAQVSAGLQVWR
jgi:hypothetical protein